MSQPYPKPLQWLNGAALLLALCGITLRVAAVGFAGSAQDRYLGVKLITAGPYAWIRHPRYTANALVAWGVSLFTGRLELFALVLLLSIPVLSALKKREEEYFLQILPQEYSQYRQQTSAYFPLRVPRKRGEGRFSWQVVFTEREFKRSLLWIFVFLILFARRYLI